MLTFSFWSRIHYYIFVYLGRTHARGRVPFASSTQQVVYTIALHQSCHKSGLTLDQFICIWNLHFKESLFFTMEKNLPRFQGLVPISVFGTHSCTWSCAFYQGSSSISSTQQAVCTKALHQSCHKSGLTLYLESSF